MESSVLLGAAVAWLLLLLSGLVLGCCVVPCAFWNHSSETGQPQNRLTGIGCHALDPSFYLYFSFFS